MTQPIDPSKISRQKTQAEKLEKATPVKEPKSEDRAPKGSWYWPWWVDAKNKAFDFITDKNNWQQILEYIFKLLKKLFKK